MTKFIGNVLYYKQEEEVLMKFMSLVVLAYFTSLYFGNFILDILTALYVGTACFAMFYLALYPFIYMNRKRIKNLNG